MPRPEGDTVKACPSSNFHPYECDGPGKCVHCDRRIVVYTGGEGTSHYEHHPAECALCDPDYDGGPQWKEAPDADACQHTDFHFDRSLCACGSMHNYCDDCGEKLEECFDADA